MRSVLVNRMACRAAHLVLGMTTIKTPEVGRLILMAGEANLVGFAGFQLGRLPDIRRRYGFGVFTARTMAALTRFGVEMTFLIGFHYLVRVLLECIEDILVAHLAGSRSDVFRRLILR